VRVILGAILWASIACAVILYGQPASVRIERVMGPEVPTGRYKHPASITELDNGDLYIAYLLPVYRETGEPNLVGADTCSLFLRFDPETKKWSETNRVYSRLGNLQPAVAQVDENHLIAYCRRGADYKPRTDGFLVRTESRDGGKTWSEGRETAFPNPNAAVDFIRLRSGNLLLVYNDSMSSRTPLTAALSTDAGKTFRPAVNIGEGENSFAYPYAIQTRDGKIRVIYTSDGRSVINMAVFEERLLLRE